MKRLFLILFILLMAFNASADTHTISNAGGNWNATTAWTEGAVPANGDDVVATGTSGNLAVNVDTADLNSFDMTGYAGTLSGVADIYVVPSSGTVPVLFAGTISWTGILKPNPANGTTINLTTGGKTISNIVTTGAGTINQQDAINLTTTLWLLETTGGSWLTNGYSITAGCGIYGVGTATRTLNINNSTITIPYTASNGQGWNFPTTTGLIFVSTGSTILYGATEPFQGGGLTYNIATFSGNGATISGNNTFNTLNVNTAGLATGLIFTINSVQTVTNFTTNGYASNLAKILSSSAGSHFHLSKAGGGQVSEDYMSIKDSTVDQANTWYAGANSTDVSGNSGWVFSPPVPSIALTGTSAPTITEADVVTGGKTIILTVTNDTWVTTGATFDAQRQNIINGIDSAQAEATGWDAEVKAKQGVAGVVRTSDTVVTITLDAQAAYNITATETITATIPATALTGNAQVVASPTFTITSTASGPANLKTIMGVAKAAIAKINGVAIAVIKSLAGVQ